MKTKIYGILAAWLLLTASCTRNLDEINTNPNAPIAVEPQLLLRQVIYDCGDEMAYEGFVAGNLLGQYFTAIDFNLFDRHGLTEPQFGGNPWPTLYANLRDVQILLDQARTNAAQSVYIGPALILKAYLTMALTDIYGDVPYSEALQGQSGNVTPGYDTQEAIYTGTGGILASLDAGIAALEAYSGTTILEGDILFAGDLEAWIRFGNSLKAKALLRISERIAVSADLSTIYNSGRWMTTNADNATFDFTAGQPNNFRMANLRSGDFNLFVMSETIDSILGALNDPRVEVLFRPYANAPNGTEFRGLRNGPDAAQTSISVADYSLTGTIFRENTALLDANFLTAWELHFLFAEAAHRGLIGADAQSLYETGVQLTFAYWHTALPVDYLTTGPAAWGNNGADPLEQIITQKWIANCLNGYEGWIEWRRTGFPAFKPVQASLNNGLIPVRMPYPTDEAALNGVNFGLQSNSINDPVWWD
ncbi:MAG: SusD/RagB family nutrient-binding outer membrane lipoprotein [Bacteroidota bacterium]